MKKLFIILLTIATFAIGADVKPFMFENIQNNDSIQQVEWDILMKYKVFGTYKFSITNNSVRLTDKSGWIGTSKGDLVLAQNGGDTLGGPIIVGGDLTFKNGPDVFTTGPLNVYGNINATEDGFKGRANIFNGFQCVKGTVDKKYEKFVPDEYKYFGDNYESCPIKDTHPNDTNLVVPYITTADTTYQNTIFIDNKTETIVVPDGSYKEPYDLYIDKISFANAGKLVISQQRGGRLTRIFLKNGISYSNNCSIVVAYRDSITGENVELENSDYSGTLLFYSLADITTASFNKDVAKFQGSIISYGKIEVSHHMVLAGQLLANNIQFDTDFDGSGFLYVPFDPPVLNIDPTALASGKFIENNKDVKIPITLDTIAKTTVYFNYCFDLDNSTSSIEDFNEPFPPICGVDSGSVVILDSTKTPVTDVFLNVKIDNLIEGDETLKLKIFNLSGAVLPGNVHTGYFTLTLTDEDVKNTSIILDKTDTIKTYQEELRIPPGTGVIGEIKYTDDRIAPLIWSFEDPSGLFTVVDGVIKTNHVFDYETEDTTYIIKVKVADGEFLDSANYLIKIVNVQEPITITGKVDKVNENTDIGTPIGVIIGKDADSTAVSYTINTTDFKINQFTGVITTNTLLDFETKDSYPVKVTITSTDGSKKDTIFTIYVNDIDEPVHAHDTTITVNENTTGIIGKVIGEDEDGKPVKFYSNDTLHYIVDSITGTIRLVEPFDYEITKNDTLKVIVKDVNGNTDTATVAIEIKNINESPVLQPNDSLTVPENCKNCIVGIITATDLDKDQIKYTVKEPGYIIDSAGVLKLKEPLDYEKTPVVTIIVIATDPSGAGDTATYKITVTNINEPVHTKDTTCSVKENYTGKVCTITGTDDDGTKPIFIVTDTTNYKIDSTGQLVIKNHIDYEKKTKDTVKVIVTDGEFSDTAIVIINVIDVDEITVITKIDDKQPVDTLKTNNTDHKIDYKICEGDNCDISNIDITVHKDTTVKVCNIKKTKCDSVVILFNDVPPVVTLTNAKSTNTYIDYITIEEQKDDKIYVNKKENTITVEVKDTVHKTEKQFELKIKLDTIQTNDITLKEYNYLIDETKATVNPIGGNKGELVEIIKDNGTEVTIKQIIDLNTGKPIDTVQTVSYIKKVNGKDVVVTYKTDNFTGQKIGDYEVSYMVDSCTKVTYTMNDKKQINKNKEGNISYTITYEYVDDYGNKAYTSVEIVYDDIPPKVEILEPYGHETFNTNAITVKWTVNGEVQDTLTLQRLEKGFNFVIRRYVDKAGNESADTALVIMKEAKDIDITIIHPVTEIDKDKVDEFYSTGEKYDPNKPYKVTIVNPKDKSLPETIGIGFKIDIALPSINPTGGLADLSDIVKNGQIPVDDKGNVVGASTKGIPVEQYVEEHCTTEFQEDYRKNGLNIPLYDVKYNLHLWVWTTTANYVNDFIVEYTLNDQETTSDAGTVQLVVDWLTDKEGSVRAKGGKALGTGSYITKLYSKSVAKQRCDYKDHVKGDKTVKKEENTKIFGYKRPTKNK